jgi:hypothetical protein
MAIYRKLAEIQSAVKAMTKNKEGYNYEYVTGDKLLNSIRPLMVSKGLLLLPSVKKVETQVIGYAAWDRQAKAVVTKTEILYVVYLEMKWVDSEDGETLIEEWAGSGMNAFDKGFGSALTYGERYYLLKTFHIATDRDDVDVIATDRDKALEEAYKAQASASKTAPAATSTAQNPVKQGIEPRSISVDILNKYIIGQAENKPTKSGKTCRQAYIDNYHPTDAMLSQFDDAVADYRINNNLA